MANPQNILAGMKAAGVTGTSLVWARNASGASSATLPKKADDPIDPSLIDLGNCDSKGANLKASISKTDIKSFGSLFPQGSLFTEFNGTVDVTFQETNPHTVEMFRGLPLGSLKPDSTGAFSVGVGMPQDVRYQLVLTGFSQHNDPMTFVLPNVANTSPGDFNFQMGQVLDRPVTFTLYPDESGNLFYELYKISGLVSAQPAQAGSGG